MRPQCSVIFLEREKARPSLASIQLSLNHVSSRSLIVNAELEQYRSEERRKYKRGETTRSFFLFWKVKEYRIKKEKSKLRCFFTVSEHGFVRYA